MHTASPDHWLPFVLVGKAQGWSRRKLASIVTKAGLGHVGTTSAIGMLTLIAGLEISKFAENLEFYMAGPMLISADQKGEGGTPLLQLKI